MTSGISSSTMQVHQVGSSPACRQKEKIPSITLGKLLSVVGKGTGVALGGTLLVLVLLVLGSMPPVGLLVLMLFMPAIAPFLLLLVIVCFIHDIEVRREK